MSASFRASDDETLQCYQAERWGRDDSLVEYLQFMFSPHGLDYVSPVNALFLYKLKDLQQLSYFKNVFVRDGALLLFKFFIQNPSPGRLKTNLILSEKLCFLVPTAWSAQTYYYRSYSSRIEKPQTVLLHGIMDEYNLSDKVFDQKINQLKSLYPNSRFAGLLNFPFPETQEDLWKWNQFHAKIYKKLLKLFPDFQFLNWNEAQKLPASNLALFDIGHGEFWYSDSYLNHYFLQKGSSLISNAKTLENSKIIEKIDFSSFHGLSIHQHRTEKSLSLGKQLYQDYDEAKDLVFNNENGFPKLIAESRFMQPTSRELMSFMAQILERTIE